MTAAIVPPRTSMPAAPQRIVVMGVSGAGKSSVGAALARQLALRFVDGDALHAPESLAKLRRGIALVDADRWPWLDRVGACLRDAAGTSPRGTVVACSALRRAHRDRLRARATGLRFLFLDAPAGVLQARMAARPGHPMPVSLLPDQLRTLEPPGADEPDVLHLAAQGDVGAVVAAAITAWSGTIGFFHGGALAERADNPRRSTPRSTD